MPASVSSRRVDWVNLLRLDYWFDLQAAQRPAGALVWAVVVISALGVGVGLSLVARRRVGRAEGAALALAFGLTGLVALGRALNVPILGARAGWLLAVLIGGAPFGLRWVQQAQREGAWRDALSAVAFAPPRSAGDWRSHTALVWALGHGFALCVLVVNLNLPLALGVGLWALAVALWGTAALLRARRGLPVERWTLSALSPLGWAYLATLLFFGGVRVEGVLNGVLSPLLALIVSYALSLVIALRWLARAIWHSEGDSALVRWGGVALVAATLGWAVWTAEVLRAHGVAGSDPFAYVQMGVDLVTRGSVLHPFPLADLAYRLGIPVYPVVHVGYRLPDPVNLEAATVWPPGYAAFTGLAYALLGEVGLYWVTPLVNLAALFAVGWLGLVAMPNGALKRTAIAALTILLTATSLEQVRWQMVPMADLAAQGLTALSLALALSVKGAPVRAVLSGLCLGFAFDVRYTQVLAAPAIALAIYLDDPKRALHLIALCAAGAWLAALPVLAYHQVVFSNPFVTGSDELAHFSLARVPETAHQTLIALGSHREFGLLAPWIALGIWIAWRAHRRKLFVFAVLTLILGGFHLLYPYVRLRDVLFLFPVFNWLAAVGMVGSVEWLQAFARAETSHSPLSAGEGERGVRRSALPVSEWIRRNAPLLQAGLVFSLSFIVVLRSMETLALPVTRGFEGFGRLVREQRAALDQLRALTPPDAVIGCSLNSGAVALYAQRQTFRPSDWSAEDAVRFVAALQAGGRPVFILDDSETLPPTLAALRQHFALQPVAQLPLPFYDAVGGGAKNRQVWLYRVEGLPSPPAPP